MYESIYLHKSLYYKGFYFNFGKRKESFALHFVHNSVYNSVYTSCFSEILMLIFSCHKSSMWFVAALLTVFGAAFFLSYLK